MPLDMLQQPEKLSWVRSQVASRRVRFLSLRENEKRLAQTKKKKIPGQMKGEPSYADDMES